MKGTATKQISVALPYALYEECKRYNINMSAVVKNALADEVETMERLNGKD